MIYALIVASGLLLLVLLVRRVRGGAAARGLGAGRWRWYPSPLGLLLLSLLVGLLLWRLFPTLLFIPIILPLFWRPRRLRLPFFSLWNPWSRPSPPGEGRDGDDGAIEGRYRPLDDA